MRGDENVYPHPKKKSTLVVDNKEIHGVDVRRYEYFWNHHDNGSYSLDELKAITEIFDQNLEDSSRRFHGDFFTPKSWVDKAHEYIERDLGADWRDGKYLVWDMACGTKNLTREYDFSDEMLYMSTLHEEELSVSADYNTNGVSFQYDFLNDDVDVMHGADRPTSKSVAKQNEWLKDRPTADEVMEAACCGELGLPLELVEWMYHRKPVVMFANPPYGSNGSGQGKDHKAGIAHNNTKDIMPPNYGHAKQELCTQFIYRTQLLADLFGYTDDDEFHFFLFNKGFLTSPSYGKFVKSLTSQFHYNSGFMMNAGEFSGTSSAWGIIFSHWSTCGIKNQNEFPFDVLQTNRETLEIEKIDDWNGINVKKGDTISNWLAAVEIPKEQKKLYPLTKNGYDTPTFKSILCVPCVDSIGYLHNTGNNIHFSEKYIGHYTLGFASAHGRDVTKDNFTRAAMTFSIRRSVYKVIERANRIWVRDKDIFTRPSDELTNNQEFINDCVVYSLFDSQSNQTSLRDYEYNGNTFQVYNEFFPFSSDFVKDLAIKSNNLPIQIDIDNHKRSERFSYTWLHNKQLSQEAQDLLNYVKVLFEKSMKDRNNYSVMFPRYQTNNWDQGWLSIRTMMFGRDRVSDKYLKYRHDFDKKLQTLGDKIAQQAFDDGIIDEVKPYVSQEESDTETDSEDITEDAT